ncbi:class I SAM-dependent methyltransferase [Bremerella sp. P1]|uniref:class I SAM-dependent methyltransferase n=1 Tax=Bremerella sp. P1 TaxID=3026424 RepID=UPI002368A58B|nr:class I SAM-dependent methyltransferase [Bremerella sp. P1]WDI39961.1 class I SAM-dependent methyltransferase [Bremerella sp. P1]
MNPKHTISLTTLQKTLLITLHAKALESQFQDSILNDHYAARAAEQIDFNFSRFRLSHNAIVALAIRAKALDLWTQEFLQENRQANVVHLGCGLDSRQARLSPGEDVAWWEVDYPEVVSLREKIYEEQPGCHLLGANILDDDWLQAIPSDVPTIVVAEGVLPYFSEAKATRLLSNIVSHFSAGQIAFDAYNRWGVMWLNQLPIMRQTQEKLHWAVDDPRKLEVAVQQLRLKEENTNGLPDFVKRAGFWSRTAFRLSRGISPFKRMGQLLLYDFGTL